uniref:Uncharacterized protein n=1 Tax=Romanomermis culicivorax TaxID=13658 RepID=A0A915L9C2_ROMCU
MMRIKCTSAMEENEQIIVEQIVTVDECLRTLNPMDYNEEITATTYKPEIYDFVPDKRKKTTKAPELHAPNRLSTPRGETSKKSHKQIDKFNAIVRQPARKDVFMLVLEAESNIQFALIKSSMSKWHTKPGASFHGSSIHFNAPHIPYSGPYQSSIAQSPVYHNQIGHSSMNHGSQT